MRIPCDCPYYYIVIPPDRSTSGAAKSINCCRMSCRAKAEETEAYVFRWNECFNVGPGAVVRIGRTSENVSPCVAHRTSALADDVRRTEKSLMPGNGLG